MKFYWVILLLCEHVLFKRIDMMKHCRIQLDTLISLAGMLVGSYFFGVAGDLVGRRRSLIFAMLVNSLCGFASSLSQGKAVFFAWRFFGGLG